jgi:hypothetical protein
MTLRPIALAVCAGAVLLVAGVSPLTAQQSPAAVPSAVSTAEIDRDVWLPLVESVKTDDIALMSSTYAPHAVLVTPRTTQAMRDALAGWGRDMVTNTAKGTRARVEFRFSRRMDGATTAFETGIFNYTTIDSAGVEKPGLYPFEELLAKIDGHWRILMERQFPATTQAEWDKLPRWPPAR